MASRAQEGALGKAYVVPNPNRLKIQDPGILSDPAIVRN